MQKDIYSVLLHLYEKTNETDSINYYSKKIFEIDEKNKAKNISVKKIIDNKNNTIKKELTGNNRKLIYILVAIILLCSVLIFLSLFFYKKYKSRKFDKKDNPVSPAVSQTNYHELFEEIVLLAKQNKPEFLTRFNELYPGFSNKILAVNSDIQSSEIRFSAYLYLNFSTKEIAEYTHISVRTVQTKKYNLRKKLNIPTDMDIYVWFNRLMQ
ncbi:helix-turn-helix transcriptional regulator [Chryseobacterium tongliaoense]|uniref:helix-turn-helix transcriptional regulator n=1 Tax=Chryseobacterium tongliaoense TaxID=3240933 RepID=UPI0035172AE0